MPTPMLLFSRIRNPAADAEKLKPDERIATRMMPADRICMRPPEKKNAGREIVRMMVGRKRRPGHMRQNHSSTMSAFPYPPPLARGGAGTHSYWHETGAALCWTRPVL